MVYLLPLIDSTDTSGPSASTTRTNAEVFLIKIAAVLIQRCHTNSPEDVYVPRAKKHRHFVAFLLKLHATAAVRLCLINAAKQNPQIHPVQDDGLKQATKWMHTSYVENTGQL